MLGIFGVILGSYWGNVDVPVRIIFGPGWVIVGSVSGNVGVMLGSFWGNIAIILASFWDNVGVLWG